MQGEIHVRAGTTTGLKDANGVDGKRMALRQFCYLQENDERSILTAIDRSLRT